MPNYSVPNVLLQSTLNSLWEIPKSTGYDAYMTPTFITIVLNCLKEEGFKFISLKKSKVKWVDDLIVEYEGEKKSFKVGDGDESAFTLINRIKKGYGLKPNPKKWKYNEIEENIEYNLSGSPVKSRRSKIIASLKRKGYLK
jgi:hypothetical protein